MSQWLKWAERIQALSQAGLAHAQDGSDRERYEELERLAQEMVVHGEPPSEEHLLKVSPILDVRGVIFDGDRIMLVQDADEGRWALPGGYCDASLSPAENIIEVIEEESGVDVVPVRLLALFDTRQHPHPSGTDPSYKLFIECALLGEGRTGQVETEAVGFFGREDLPELSTARNTVEQLHMCFDAHWQEQDWTTLFD